jgi:3-oxoacyl-(acyl-carrier-protein) synthase III
LSSRGHLNVRILGTASSTPGQPVSTEHLARELGLDPADLQRKTGIRTRHWAGPETRAVDVGADVLRGALAAAGMEARELRRIVYVSTMGHDLLVPATGNLVAGALGIDGTCDTFDVANACTGFLTGFDLAARSVATGLGPTAVVVVELNSRLIRKEYARSYVIMGDAAAAVVLGEGRSGEGVLGTYLGSSGAEPRDSYMEHPQLTGRREHFQFAMFNRDISEKAIKYMLTAAQKALAQAGLSPADVAWILPHQPNGPLFEAACARFEADPAKLVPVVADIGSTGAASVAYSLDQLLRTRPVRPADHILMMAVGSGVSYGALVYRVGG